MRNAPVAYLRYRSSICPTGRRPVTKKVLDVEVLKPEHIIVAVSSPERKFMHLHLNRVTGRVYYIEPDEPLDFNSSQRRLVGLHGEFVTP